MKTNTFTSFMPLLFSLWTVSIFAGDLDGFWRSTDLSKQIEVMYTTNGIKARQADRYGNDWVSFNRLDNNRYRDNRGNSLSLFGSTLEWCSPDRRQIINYTRYNSTDSHNRYGDYGNGPNNNGRNDYRDRDWNDRDRSDHDRS
jgi:hypothetical protein